MDGATEERRGFHRLFGFSFEEEPGGGETASLAGLDAKPGDIDHDFKNGLLRKA